MSRHAARLAPSLTLGACLLLALAGCRVSVNRAAPSAEAPTAGQLAETRATLVRLMEQSRDAWNRADLQGHVAMYTDSATMMSGQGPLGGRDVIRGMLERGFWEGGQPKAKLDFSDLVVRPLGRDHALMTGAFLLTYPDGRTSNGRYSLVWVRENGQWRIMHDHSS
jgi:uncharacterized protein (TIGR02246 family)